MIHWGENGHIPVSILQLKQTYKKISLKLKDIYHKYNLLENIINSINFNIAFLNDRHECILHFTLNKIWFHIKPTGHLSRTKILTSDAQLVFVLNWFCHRQINFRSVQKTKTPIQLILATYQHDNLYKKLAKWI